MNENESPFLSVLRDRDTTITQFRDAAESLVATLVHKAAALLPTEAYELDTPLTSTRGRRFSGGVILVPILRSGLSMLAAFERVFREASVGFVGMRRDEETAIPSEYYCNIPPHQEGDWVIILDPMLATGGTLIATIKLLVEKGVEPDQIIYSGIIAAPEGVAVVEKAFPQVKLLLCVVDDHLNDQKFIVPGLGDFGDRYYGTT